MLKKFTIVVLFTCLVFAGNAIYSQGTNAKAVDAAKQYTVIKVSDFADKAPEMVGKSVQIEGMVTHVCRHSGKKLFIISGNPDINVKITSSDKISVFDTELEGTNIRVKGIVEAIQADPAAESEEKKSEDAVHANVYDKPQYSISCLNLEVIKE